MAVAPITNPFGLGRETITPGRAEQMLKHNKCNRRLDDRVVDRYARDMRSGDWWLTGEAIAFDSDGNLTQGQHRLHGCVRAGVPFETVVIRGVDPRAQIAMDSGKKRSLSDQLRFLGEKNTSELAASISLGWQYDRGFLPNRAETLTAAEATEWLRANPAVRKAVLVAKSVAAQLPVGRTAVSLTYFVTARVDRDEADMFMGKLVSGVGMDDGNPILAVRRWLDRWSGKRDKPSVITYAHALLKACNYYRAGRQIAFMKVLLGEPFPRVFGE